MDRNQLQRQVALKRSSLFEQQFLDPQQFVQLEDLEDDANPNFVEEIVTLFYKDSARLFQKIEQTMQSRPIDFGKLDDYMHQFKGSSSSIGAIKVKNECSQFKEFCLAGNAEGCFWAFQRVKQEHHTLRIQLESYFLDWYDMSEWQQIARGAKLIAWSKNYQQQHHFAILWAPRVIQGTIKISG